jgi:signal transduction histidine kinase
MEERVALLGGRFKINTGKNWGTEIKICLPLLNNMIV